MSGLGTGGKAQQFAQTMALANFQKELLLGGKAHMVGDDKLFNTASEITKIMGHKNPDKFFDDPSAKDPQTGQPLHPPRLLRPAPKRSRARCSCRSRSSRPSLTSRRTSARRRLSRFRLRLTCLSEQENRG
jgi:hypothetical protein